MPPRENIVELVARAQQVTDPELLERIAARLYDALMEKAQDLRKNAASSPSRENGKKRGATNS